MSEIIKQDKMTSKDQQQHDKIDKLLAEAESQVHNNINEARKKLNQALSIIRIEHNKLNIK